ncbi:metallophosphoesterase family protein [Mumia flava]|uniref:metallophosphoesterase family protein n=1 Tax=Mumia flava TaxID=1348852 RepID=UPI000C23B74C|nr:metallophosphoesterase [Mumia flava]
MPTTTPDAAPEPPRARRPRPWQVLVLVAITLAVAVPVALMTFTGASRTVVVGAHTAVVTPTFDEHATVDFGSVLPSLRMPVDQPFGLGVNLDVGDTDADSLNQLVARDAVIASQPDAEIERIAVEVRDMAISSALRGLGAGVLAAIVVAALWVVVGQRRRREILARARRAGRRHRVGHGPLRTTVAFALAIALAVVLLTWPEPDEETTATPRWRSITEVYPDIPDDLGLEDIEITTGSATDASQAIVQSAITTYDKSVTFYGELEDTVAEIAPALRQPEEGETVAVFVTDRHDNVGMDPVVRALGDEVGATLLIDAGDDTSSGGDWESFSVRSLANQFRDYDKVAVAGNHDHGPFVAAQLADEGFTVLDGEPEEVAGIRFLGFNDPRSSGYTAEVATGETTIEEQGAELVEIACEEGADVSTVVVHSPTTGQQVAESGCVDLVLAGHMHVQQGPTTLTAENGRRTVTFTNGTTGGAAFSFALGSKLRRTAQASLVTFRDGRPVGLQPVNFQPGGRIDVEEYVAFDLGEPTLTAPAG